uniref:DUF659 domain-containing protein n=1 Tax=Lactuca sativa TaxID=4236 RepID=A0A9R1XG89_LACSA|nr:hypothetical protein LSAT_V11C400215580 [Lactuca sativa]
MLWELQPEDFRNNSSSRQPVPDQISSYFEVLPQLRERSRRDVIIWSLHKPLLNVVAVNARGAVFMYADDYSGVEKTGVAISKFLRGAIEAVGPSNVLQMVTDNAANCKATGCEIEKAISSKNGTLDTEVIQGVMESFNRFSENEEEGQFLREQFITFHIKICIYSMVEIQMDALTMDPIDWWSTYEVETPDLALVAKKARHGAFFRTMTFTETFNSYLVSTNHTNPAHTKSGTSIPKALTLKARVPD